MARNRSSGDLRTYDKAIEVIQEARICLLAGARIKDSSDPTDALLVLLSAPLSELHGQLFDPEKFAALVKKQFAWEMSTDAVEFFIPKMRTLGWLRTRAGLPSRGPLEVNLPEPETEATGSLDTQAALEELGRAFKEFANDLSPFEELPEDPAEAGALLLKHVVDANLPLSSNDTKARSDESFLASRFVEHVNKEKLPARDMLASLSAVGFLFRVADEIAQPTKRRSTELRVVIDGPILLDCLGCSGPVRAKAARDIVGGLKSINVSCVTFEHCVREARSALSSVLRALPHERYGPTGEALRKGWANEKGLLALLQTFELSVRKSGIEILPSDRDFSPNLEKFFSEELSGGVESIINWHDEGNSEARYADADTTVLTIRRRAGYRTTDLFMSKYVCVTSNEAFAGTTRRHLLDIAYYNGKQVPPVITLKELAAKLWLEVGNSDKAARLSLPNSQLLVTCEKALRFNRKVVDAAKAELEKVKPEQVEQFELLLQIPRSARAVMDVTLNNERYVRGDTIDSLLEAAVEAAGDEVAAKAKAQRARDQEKFRRELSATEAKLAEEQERADEHQRAALAAREERRRDQETVLESIGASATERFQGLRTPIRLLSVFVALVPLIAAIAMVRAGTSSPWALALAFIAFLLALATAMDRPGAWLTRAIQKQIRSGSDKALRNVGQYDLAESFDLIWADGEATAIRREAE